MIRTITIPQLYATFTLLCMTGMGMALIFHQVPAENREMLSTVVGALAGALMGAGATHTFRRNPTP